MKNSKYTYTEVELREAVKHSRSYAQVLKELNLTASGNAYYVLKNHIKRHGIDITHFTGQGYLKGSSNPYVERIPLIDILSGKHPQYQSHKLRLRLLKEGYFKHICSNCKNTEWLNQPIPLELEHINGIHDDHRLENLSMLCPNCHAQTVTHAGKNIGRDSRSRTDTP